MLDTSPVLHVWCRTCWDQLANIFTVTSQKQSYNLLTLNLSYLTVFTVSFHLNLSKTLNPFSCDFCFSSLAIHFEPFTENNSDK